MSSPEPARPLDRHSVPGEKIARFRSLFRGRTDVYPRRFVSRRTRKAGYSPACGNEWVHGVCEKPRIKCSDCPHQCWLPVSDETVRWHLSGRDAGGGEFVMGVYPMLADESCWFLAIDLDGDGWMEDARALAEAVRASDLPVALERSRSGNGAHVWLFFESAVPAALARRLGTHLLTAALEARPEVGLGSYDRLFPNQDTLPRGGFGNLIALPLQKAAREVGHSLFVDEGLEPFADQWDFLGRLRKIAPERVAEIVAGAERSNRLLPVRLAPDEEFALTPWRAPPSRRSEPPLVLETLPKRLAMVLADRIYIPKEGVPPALRNRLLRLAAFQNPEFHRAQAMRLPTYDKPRIIACAEDHAKHIALPRGCLDELRELLKRNRIRAKFEDQRQTGTALDVSFKGELRPEQRAAAEALLAHETGVLAATTAFGKTVLAAWLIARRGVNTLVLVHRQQLMEQWVERLGEFLDLPQKEIGRLGGGRRKLGGRIDVALIQSLVRKEVVDDRVADYGHLIVDECHHLSARSFELAVSRARAKYVLGLSATIQRKDGHHPIIFMQCGPVRHRVNAKEQADARPFRHHVIVRPTAFHPSAEPLEDARVEFQRLCDSLSGDATRNALIVSDVLAALKDGRHPLVLTERTAHLEVLAGLFAEAGAPVVVLRGGMGRKQLEAAGRLLSDDAGPVPIVLATGRYAGEGFDHAVLDTLFVTMPVSWRGTIAQYVGRLHRLYEGKREVRVYDYADLDSPMLARMFDKRCAGYETVGYSILLPASAVPGWPTEVALPVDSVWKREYAASVRRLIRDGVDPPLAGLFVRAVDPPGGIEGARSAAEAFLFRRIETLDATRGRFQLNAELPIPFNSSGTMEVDFLCEAAGIAVELDGPQHLADEEAWRSDRRKDALLQRHGYFVLRFLATDVSRNLDQVLDDIAAAIAFRDHQREKA